MWKKKTGQFFLMRLGKSELLEIDCCHLVGPCIHLQVDGVLLQVMFDSCGWTYLGNHWKQPAGGQHPKKRLAATEAWCTSGKSAGGIRWPKFGDLDLEKVFVGLPSLVQVLQLYSCQHILPAKWCLDVLDLHRMIFQHWFVQLVGFVHFNPDIVIRMICRFWWPERCWCWATLIKFSCYCLLKCWHTTKNNNKHHKLPS